MAASSQIVERSCKYANELERDRLAAKFYNGRMQFLSISRRRTDQFPPEAFTPDLVAQEGERVKALYASGILRQIWRRGDQPGASILWEAVSETAVREAISSLPIAKAGMLELVALIPLEPYPGFGPSK